MTMRVVTLAVLLAGMLFATTRPAEAQLSLAPISGLVTGHLGTATGLGGAGTTLSGGGSMAVVEQTGWGAEFDAGFASDDGGRTGGLSVQTYILNVLASWPRGRLRPFGVVGAGALRARSCTAACAGTIAWSDWAMSAGGGVQYLRNEVFGIRGDIRYLSNIGNPGRAPDGVRLWRVSVGATLIWVAD